MIVPTPVSAEFTIPAPRAFADKTPVPFILYLLPDAKFICSDDVHESVASTQFHVLSVSLPASTVIPAPSAAASFVAPLAISMFLSSTLKVAVLIVVVDPST